MHPPAPETLTPEQYLQRKTIRVVTASLTDACNICQAAYKTPLVLSCGHIFCRECIEPWFHGGAHTCPVCRAELFTPGASHPSSRRAGDDMTERFGSFAMAPRPAYAGALVSVSRPVSETLHRGVVVARDGVLSRGGACLIVRDLWRCTAVLLRGLSEFSVHAIGLEEVGDVDVEVLRSVVRQVIPRGVRLGEGCWAVLCYAVRLMLVWHSRRRAGEARWRMEGGEEFERMVEELLAASHEEDMR